MIYSFGKRKFFVTILLTFSLIIALIGFAGAEEITLLIIGDDFDDYVVGTYSGSNGPGMWYQDYSGGSATYQIVSSGGRTFYKLQSSDGVFVKAVLPYYFLGLYIGPADYTFSTTMKVDHGEGGIIFRVQPVQIGGAQYLRKYYLATIYKNSKKLVLWYVDEREGAGAGPKLAEVDVPSTIDLNNWFGLSVTVKGNGIKVSIGGREVIDVTDNRLSYGSVGLYTFKGCTASFDNVNWIGYISQTAATTTSTVTETTTATAPADTVTETITRTDTTTVTLAEIEKSLTTITTTATLPAEVSTKTEKVTEVQTKTETSAITVTKMETATITQPGGPGCLIATAAFGSEIAPQVQDLREYRDEFVMSTFAGKNFVKAFNAFYYSWSPYVAQAEYDNPALRSIIKTAIYPLLFSLDASKNAASIFSAIPELAVLISGLVAASFIGLIYFAPLAASIFLVLRWRGRNFSASLLYPVTVLAAGLLSFILAEASTSSQLMVIASSMIVLSMIAICAIAPIKVLSSIRGVKKKP